MAFDGIAISVDWRLVYPIPVKTIFENYYHQCKQRDIIVFVRTEVNPPP
jgi:hypothetical protein